ncbi:MAG: mechanosensitive ion channel [Prevotella sp.]|nr:mechanosensitive ion channel [Prevotella sp.]
MKTISIYVDSLIEASGLTGNTVPVVRHILLVIVAVVLSALAGILFRKILKPLVLKITARTKNTWDDILLSDRVLTSASQIAPAIVIWVLLPMVFSQYIVVREILARITAIYITVMSVRLAIVLIDSLQQLGDGKRSAMHQYFHSFCGVLKILIIFIAVIVVVAIVINKNPATLFAGLGATSAIMMLVFKDTISGLVAGIRLTSNDMLHKGDWITVPKSGVDGNVEDITLTTVKVRNFDNTIVTVTPQTLVDDSFQNWIGMQNSPGRRVKRRVFYDFRSIRPIDDVLKAQLVEKKYFAEKDIKPGVVNLTLFRIYVERYLAANPMVNANMTLMVRQLEPTSTGLPVEFYFFVHDKEWVAYEHNLAGIMEHIYAVTPHFGLTIYQQLTDASTVTV